MSDNVTNKDRADWADSALMHFAEQVGILGDDGELGESEETVVRDFLCDLYHYCGQNNLDLDQLIVEAKEGYEEELAEEAEEEDDDD